MPRGKGATKSQAIREYLTENPGASVKDVIAGLGGQGIKIKANLVYFIKGKMKAGKQRRKKIAKAARAASSNGDPLTLIRDIKSLAERSGGFEKLKKLVEALAN